jgi:flavin reductase (DIM6/NTAB) family NADH-FMN oxidoreductase RutF
MPEQELGSGVNEARDPYELMKAYTRSGKRITTADRTLDLLLDGVTVVTTVYQGRFYGLSVAWVTRVSGANHLVLAVVAHNSHTHRFIKQSGVFAMNVLGEDQTDVARHFGRQTGTDVDKFKRQDHYWETRQTGAPILLDALGYLDCGVVAAYDPPGGDHTLFVGDVLDASILRPGHPLIYRRQDYPYRVDESLIRDE